MTITIPDAVLWLALGLVLIPVAKILWLLFMLKTQTDWRYSGKWRRERRRARKRKARLAEQYGEHGRLPVAGEDDDHPGLYRFVCGTNTYDPKMVRCNHEDPELWMRTA